MEPKKRGRKKVVKDVVVRQEPVSLDLIKDVILKGDLRQFSPEQKVKYYTQVCTSLGLNPFTKPFDMIVLNDREVLYPNKGAAEQLRKIHGISIVDMHKTQNGPIYEVTVKAQDNTGRFEIATGSVPLTFKDGTPFPPEMLSNARMKAETKAKRRVTFALCGLGMLDETEIETIQYPDATYSDDNSEKMKKVEKLKSLPADIIEGLRLLGYKTDAAYLLCEQQGWDNEKIKSVVNQLVDKKNGN